MYYIWIIHLDFILTPDDWTCWKCQPYCKRHKYHFTFLFIVFCFFNIWILLLPAYLLFISCLIKFSPDGSDYVACHKNALRAALENQELTVGGKWSWFTACFLSKAWLLLNLFPKLKTENWKQRPRSQTLKELTCKWDEDKVVNKQDLSSFSRGQHHVPKNSVSTVTWCYLIDHVSSAHEVLVYQNHHANRKVTAVTWHVELLPIATLCY